MHGIRSHGRRIAASRLPGVRGALAGGQGDPEERMDTAQDGSFALVEALAADLRGRLDGEAPVVVYAWTRRVKAVNGERIVMFAKLFQHHHSDIVEADGLDADQAYRCLVERCQAWVEAADTPS